MDKSGAHLLIIYHVLPLQSTFESPPPPQMSSGGSKLYSSILGLSSLLWRDSAEVISGGILFRISKMRPFPLCAREDFPPDNSVTWMTAKSPIRGGKRRGGAFRVNVFHSSPQQRSSDVSLGNGGHLEEMDDLRHGEREKN